MRIVLIGVSHWHTPFYLDPLLTMPDTTVIGVSDPDPARAEEVAAKPRCPAFDDYREMCARLKPDFAFVLGRASIREMRRDGRGHRQWAAYAINMPGCPDEIIDRPTSGRSAHASGI